MKFSSVKEILNEAIRILNSSTKIRERYAADIKALERRRDISSSDTYRMGVIGVTSSGKSTLINSLMGESILPSRACPSSSQLVRCHYSDERKVIVYFENGSNLSLAGVKCNQESISSYADEGFNSNNKEQVKELELCSPNFPLGKDVVLVDSPGLDAFGYEGHEKLTMASLLPTVDSCILVTTCKTNSDQKLLSVLDTIAENSAANMPVILVQNMIDSIVPSADGLKSTNDVAKDHRRRLQRVIDSSKIKDKRTAKIVQYSAQWALEGRISDDDNLLFKSNYQSLVDSVNEIILSIKPVVIKSRLLRAKREIDRLALDAKQAAGGDVCISAQESFEYDGLDDVVKNYISDVRKRVDSVISKTERLRDKYINISHFTESTVANVKRQISNLEDSLVSEMCLAEDFFTEICEKLNIEKRDIAVTITLSGISAPHLCQTTVSERVKEKGIKGFFKRLNPFGSADSGYEYITHTYIDVQATERLILDYILSAKKVFKESLGKFEKRLKDIQKCFTDEIELRKLSFEARQSKFLEAAQYADISYALTNLSSSVVIDESFDIKTNYGPVERPEDNLVEMECPFTSYALYKMSETIKRNIYTQTVESFIHYSKNRILVLGWDKFSEAECLDKFFNCKISVESIPDDQSQINDKLSLFHIGVPTYELNLNGINVVFILVNATQIGSAEKQIYPLLTKGIFHKKLKVIFVVQDFAEVIATGDICGVLTELRNFIKRDLNRSDIDDILLVHRNPIYNLAISAIQQTGLSLQSDSVTIANDLKTRFGYLYDKESNSVIHDMLKSFEL